MILTREQAKETINRDIPITDYLHKARNGGYICPYCRSGEGVHGTGAVKVYSGTNTAACHACPDPGKQARKFDTLDAMQAELDTDFNGALEEGARILGFEIAPYKSDAAADFDDRRINEGWKQHKTDRTGGRTYPAPAQQYDIHHLELNDNSWMNDTPKPPAQGAQKAPESPDKREPDKTPAETAKAPQEGTQTATAADYGDYYKACQDRLDDPAAVSYLQARGISIETARACWIGYDPQADPANAPGAMGNERRPHPAPRLIIPTSRAHYVGRSIDPETPKAFQKLNPNKNKGASGPGIFNGPVLYDTDRDGQTAFIVEGAFDAMSIIESGAAAVALNSKSNGEILLQQIKARPPVIQRFIVCPDNDLDPKTNADTQKRAQALCRDIKAAGYTCIVSNVAGGYHDVNDALKGDRAALFERIAEAQEAAQYAAENPADTLPGLLHYEDVLKEFQEADDDIIEIKSFPEFSKLAKIKKHSTVAIAADTGGGKSSLSLNILNDLNSNYPCIYFNLEMDKITVLRRLVAIQGGLELDRIEGYKTDPETAAAVNAYLKAITERKPLQIIQGDQDGKNCYSLEQIEGIIKESTAGRKETTIVFIDHSLLVELSAHTAGRYERFTLISERLRKIALNNEIVLFVLLQQNREGKKDDTERPRNSSLKESGSWENDATHICFLWYDPQDRRKKLLLTKNRGGENGEFTLNYWKRTQTYTEAKEQPARIDSPAGRDFAPKPTRREKAQEKLQTAYSRAAAATEGKPTLRAIAEAADVTTATVRGWIREYGGCIVDGVTVDPAGIDTEVEYTGFIKLTPADNSPFIGTMQDDAQAPAAPRKRL